MLRMATADSSQQFGSSQFTVSSRVVECCNVPAVAVTVMVEVTGGGEVDFPLPHPVSRLAHPTLTASSKSRSKRRRFFNPKQHAATASAAPGNSVLPCRTAAAVEEVATFIVVVEAAVPDGVTVEGEKTHDAPEGNPEQLKVTGAPNPFTGVTEIVVVPLSPALIVRDAGELPTAKSCGRLMV